MIRRIINNDIDEVNLLGLEYDDKFTNHYHLKDYLSDPLYVINVYEEDHIIKGFIISNKLYENVEILLVYVAPLYRKSGIATKLINNLSTLDGVQNILLEVSKENNPAYNLYLKLGFNKLSTRKGYYNGVDAIVMKKVIE